MRETTCLPFPAFSYCLQRSLQNGKDVLFVQRSKRARCVQSLIHGNVVCHFFQTGIVNAYFTQGHRHTQTLEELCGTCNGLLGNFRRSLIGSQSEHVHTKFHDAFLCTLVEHASSAV